MAETDGKIDLSNIALFPLPGVVLFPRAILPLHIFEPRYRQMTADVLTGDKLIAMALPTGEADPVEPLIPAIYPVVCVGKIIAHQMLPDGRYNLLLQGLTRARIIEENRTRAYRRAEMEVIGCMKALDADLKRHRDTLAKIVNNIELSSTTLGMELAKVVNSPIPTADLVDLFSYSLIDDTTLKQALLSDPDVERRVRTAVEAIADLYPPELPPGARYTSYSEN